MWFVRVLPYLAFQACEQFKLDDDSHLGVALFRENRHEADVLGEIFQQQSNGLQRNVVQPL